MSFLMLGTCLSTSPFSTYSSPSAWAPTPGFCHRCFRSSFILRRFLLRKTGTLRFSASVEELDCRIFSPSCLSFESLLLSLLMILLALLLFLWYMLCLSSFDLCESIGLNEVRVCVPWLLLLFPVVRPTNGLRLKLCRQRTPDRGL